MLSCNKPNPNSRVDYTLVYFCDKRSVCERYMYGGCDATVRNHTRSRNPRTQIPVPSLPPALANWVLYLCLKDLVSPPFNQILVGRQGVSQNPPAMLLSLE